MAYKDKSEKILLDDFRRFMRSQSLNSITIRKVFDVVGVYYLVGAYDHIRDHFICLVLTREEMKQIMHVNQVFWSKLIWEPEDDLEDDEE